MLPVPMKPLFSAALESDPGRVFTTPAPSFAPKGSWASPPSLLLSCDETAGSLSASSIEDAY